MHGADAGPEGADALLGEAGFFERLADVAGALAGPDYVADGGFGTAASYFVVTLDYGPDHDKYDPFDSTARQRISQSETEHADEGHYLHPVVRHYRKGELAGTHHVTENLDNEWTSPVVHRAPLAAFIARQSGATVAPAAANQG